MLTTYWKALLHHSQLSSPHSFHISGLRILSLPGKREILCFVINKCFKFNSFKVIKKEVFNWNENWKPTCSSFSVQGFLPGHIICHNGNISLWLWEQAGTQPKQGMKRGWTRWKWSGTKGWNEWKDREEERRRRERGEKDWSRLDNRLGHCRAVLSWSTLGEMTLAFYVKNMNWRWSH